MVAKLTTWERNADESVTIWSCLEIRGCKPKTRLCPKIAKKVNLFSSELLITTWPAKMARADPTTKAAIWLLNGSRDERAEGHQLVCDFRVPECGFYIDFNAACNCNGTK